MIKLRLLLVCILTAILSGCNGDIHPDDSGQGAQKPDQGVTDDKPEKDYSLTAENHPRLFLNTDEFVQMRSIVQKGTDATLTRIHESIMELVDNVAMVESVLAYESGGSDGGLLNNVHRTALERIFLCSYAYRFTKAKKYLTQAEKTINEVCSFPDWNTKGSSLDMAEIAAGVAIGYDWLYEFLAPGTKAAAEKAMHDFALEPSSKNIYSLNFYNVDHNWNQVCNAGLVCAALATYEKYPEFAQQVIDKSVESNRRAIGATYAPDGIYPEGPSYWSYGTAFQCMLLAALDSCIGNDYGLSEIAGFEKAGKFMLFATGATEKFFNYSDTMETLVPVFPMWYFARRFNDPSLLHNELRYLAEGRYVVNADEKRLIPLVMCHACMMDLSDVSSPAEDMFVGGGVNPLVIIHTDWTYSDTDMYLGIKGGKASYNHGHMDVGSFVFDAEGVRWAMDLPRQSYDELRQAVNGELFNMSQNSQRWNVFRINNKQHNTLTINNAYHKASATAEFTSFTDTKKRKGATLDLTAVMNGEAAKVVRDVELYNGELILTDNIQAKSDKAAVVRWTMVSYAKPEIIEGGKGIRLTSQGGKVRYIVADSEQVDLTYEIFESDPRKLTDFPELRAKEKYYNNTHILGFTATVPAGQTAEFTTRLTKILL